MYNELIENIQKQIDALDPIQIEKRLVLLDEIWRLKRLQYLQDSDTIEGYDEDERR